MFSYCCKYIFYWFYNNGNNRNDDSDGCDDCGNVNALVRPSQKSKNVETTLLVSTSDF